MLGHYESDSTKGNYCFIINVKKYICKFYIHKCKFTNNKPHFIIFLKEFNNYLNTISMSENKKARKTISFCNDFNLCTVIDIYMSYVFVFFYFPTFSLVIFST